MAEKERIEAIARKIVHEVNEKKDTVNGMMAPEFVSVSEDGAVTLRFRVLPWEANRAGLLHGGIMTTMLDHTLGITAAAHIEGWSPTISLDMEYIRPANIGDSLLATASIVALGRRIIRLQGKLIHEESGKLVAACTSSFFNKEA